MTTRGSRTYLGKSTAEREAERRARFLDAALQVFADQGYANSSVADVLRVAGFSRRQFYEEFQDREELLIAVYDRIHDQAHDTVLAATDKLTAVEPREAVAAVLAAHLGYMGADRRRAQLAFVEIVGVSRRVEDHRRATRHRWAAVVETMLRALIGAGREPIGGYPLAIAAHIGAVNGLVHEWIAQPDPRPSVNTLVDVLVAMTAGLDPGEPHSA
ncbi:TetR/AcrR family transcriptional regulator [Nocardia sp. NBC_01388]|uniref:TetR/AcrR family transcriptional regulator n=1 Tax=Nocardia sp. NBC_01388 TaxID=2903596 RepID=UPI0032482EB8